MNSPFGNNVACAGRPGVRTGYKEQLYKGPAVITGDQRRWGIWAAAAAAKTTPASTSIRACDRATTMLRRLAS